MIWVGVIGLDWSPYESIMATVDTLEVGEGTRIGSGIVDFDRGLDVTIASSLAAHMDVNDDKFDVDGQETMFPCPMIMGSIRIVGV